MLPCYIHKGRAGIKHVHGGSHFDMWIEPWWQNSEHKGILNKDIGREAKIYLKHPSVIAACCFFIAFDHVQIEKKKKKWSHFDLKIIWQIRDNNAEKSLNPIWGQIVLVDAHH